MGRSGLAIVGPSVFISAFFEAIRILRGAPPARDIDLDSGCQPEISIRDTVRTTTTRPTQQVAVLLKDVIQCPEGWRWDNPAQLDKYGVDFTCLGHTCLKHSPSFTPPSTTVACPYSITFCCPLRPSSSCR